MAEARGPAPRRVHPCCSAVVAGVHDGVRFVLTTGTASYPPPLQFAVIIELLLLLLPSGIVRVSTATPHSAFDQEENHATKNKILLKEKRDIKQATTLAACGASGQERDSEQISRDDECGPG